MNEFSHLDSGGSARMVDVGHKPEQARVAVASGRIVCQQETIVALKNHALPKGDALTVARIAGIQAAKSTAQLIPLCHPLPLNHVAIDFAVGETAITIRCEASTRAATGVEMEALTGVTVAALTLYDMMKSADKTMRIEGITLLEKTKK
ncbi:MAG: cyclic pyranopterin monophosphate synthase MoaC [Verrucomicrobiota bacterium]